MRLPLYFLTTLLIFWIPSFILGAIILKRLDPPTRKAFWIAQAVFWPMSFAMEFIFFFAGAITFAQPLDPYIGIRIRGLPIEEFIYLFGATTFILSVYLGFSLLFKRTAAHD